MTIAFDPTATLPLTIPEIDTSKPLPGAESAEGTRRTEFGERLEQFVEGVNEQQQVADTAANDFAEGRSNDIHGTMISMQRADVSFRLLASVRNKALEAYREIMRMGA